MNTPNTAAQSIAITLCNKRVLALEQQCRVLAAEVNGMRPVVEAARHWYNGASNWSVSLAEAVAAYEATRGRGHTVTKGDDNET